RAASLLGREPRAGRCPPFWPGNLRNDGGGVAAGGAGGSEARLDGALCSDDRRGKEVRRDEDPGPGGLECGERAWGASRERGSTVEAAARQGAVRGRSQAPAGIGWAGIDR